MRLVVEDHDRTDLAENSLAEHMHQTHHWAPGAVRQLSEAPLALAHDDDHDDLRRGCG